MINLPLNYSIQKDRLKEMLVWMIPLWLFSSIYAIIFGPFRGAIVVAGIFILVIGLVNISYLFRILLLIMPVLMSVMTYSHTDQTPNRITSILATVIIFIWIINKLISDKLPALIPRWLFFYFLIFAIWVAIVNIHAGINQKNIMTILRMYVFFLIIIAFYDTVKLTDYKHYFWIMLSPLLAYAFSILIPAILSGSLVNLALLTIARQSAIAINANVFAGLIILFLPIMISLSLFADNLRYKKLYGIAAVVLTISLILTNSRAGYLGFFISTSRDA